MPPFTTKQNTHSHVVSETLTSRSHFADPDKAQRTSTWRYLLSPNRPPTPGELRFRRHGYFRVTVYGMLLLYFLYCNPEYSYTFSAIRKHYGWDQQEPRYPQLLKIEKRKPPIV